MVPESRQFKSPPSRPQACQSRSVSQIPGQCEVPEAVEGDVSVIHQSKDQRNIPTLIGQPLEGAEVWDWLIKSAGIKVRLRPGHSLPMGFETPSLCSSQGREIKAGVGGTGILAPGLSCLQTAWFLSSRETQSPGWVRGLGRVRLSLSLGPR